jgi:hypothetical protein
LLQYGSQSCLSLTQKLVSETFDGGAAFTFAYDADEQPQWTVHTTQVRFLRPCFCHAVRKQMIGKCGKHVSEL